MGIKDILSRMGALIASKRAEGKEMDDDETRDKYLRSLRRQKRVMAEKVEKKRLQKEIGEHFRQLGSKVFVTSDDENILKTPFNKGENYKFLQGKILKSKKRILESKLKGVKKKKQKSLSFLGKSNL